MSNREWTSEDFRLCDAALSDALIDRDRWKALAEKRGKALERILTLEPPAYVNETPSILRATKDIARAALKEESEA